MSKNFLVSLVAVVLVACSAGSNNPAGPPAPTAYSLTNFSNLVLLNSGCSSKDLAYTCSKASSALSLAVSYTSSPASYIQIPTVLPTGVGLTTAGLTCSNTAVTNYSCTISITATNTTAGSSIALPVNGSLGQAGFITVLFQ